MRNRSSVVRLFLVVSLLAPGLAPAAELEGTLALVRRGRAVRGDLQNAFVSFKPAHGTPMTPPAEPFVMKTEGKDFDPQVLAIPVGSRVRFPNFDPILHNVFSVSGANSFDVGLYARGDGETVTFSHPGTVRVFCNVHHSMVAYILVLDTPYYTSPDADGRFRLSGVPEGPGTLMVWHERSDEQRQAVVVPSGRVDLEIEVSRPRVPQHLNKAGKPYETRGRRTYR